MTRDKWRERLPLIQAFSEGKTIQWLNENNNWIFLDTPSFVYAVDRYRILPDPVEEALKIYNKAIPIHQINADQLGIAAILSAIKDGSLVL